MIKNNIETQKDWELVKKAKQGNQKAFSRLFEIHNSYILGLVNTIVKNSTDAEDIALIVFTKAFEKINTFIADHAFSTWLYRIAINESINYLRKKKHKPVITEDLFQEIEKYLGKIPSKDLNPEDILITNEEIKKFKELSKKMNPTLRRIFELRYDEHKSFNEIAEELDIKSSTVRGQLRRAKTILYKILKEK